MLKKIDFRKKTIRISLQVNSLWKIIILVNLFLLTINLGIFIYNNNYLLFTQSSEKTLNKNLEQENKNKQLTFSSKEKIISSIDFNEIIKNNPTIKVLEIETDNSEVRQEEIIQKNSEKIEESNQEVNQITITPIYQLGSKFKEEELKEEKKTELISTTIKNEEKIIEQIVSEPVVIAVEEREATEPTEVVKPQENIPNKEEVVSPNEVNQEISTLEKPTEIKNNEKNDAVSQIIAQNKIISEKNKQVTLDDTVINKNNINKVIENKTEDKNYKTLDIKELINIEDFYFVTSQGEGNKQEKIGILNQVASVLPLDHLQKVQTLMFRFDDPTAPRGLAGGYVIILNGNVSNESEFKALFTHELGHVVDFEYMQGTSNQSSEFYDKDIPIVSDDPSLEFYRICWSSSLIQNQNCNNSDFVTGYAQTDVFEDFAESYITYVLHGKEFRKMSEESTILKQKYDFIKTLFKDVEYDTGYLDNIKTSRNWDATLLRY